MNKFCKLFIDYIVNICIDFIIFKVLYLLRVCVKKIDNNNFVKFLYVICWNYWYSELCFGYIIYYILIEYL